MFTFSVVCLDSYTKMYLYSCHDDTITGILLALGCYDDEWPPYAADVAFELYEDVAGKHYVKLRYCGKVSSNRTHCSRDLVVFTRATKY